MFKFEKRQQAIRNGSHGLVIGSGIAGLLAARVLIKHFEHVTIVECDSLPEEAGARPGVPQALHSHGLLKRGSIILEQLFPGLEAELLTAGAVPIDEIADVLHLSRWGCSPRFPSDLIIPNCSRQLLEWSIRRRLTAYSCIQFLDATQVTKLLIDEQKSRIIGLQLRDIDSSQIGELTSDLVVDASGRNSLLPKWLKELGYEAPPETKVNAFLGYTTCWYERPTHLQTDWKALVISPQSIHESRFGVLYPVEGNRWLVSLYGFNRDYPPTNEVGFLEFARTLASPALYEALKEAKSLSPIYSFRSTENRWRHYEKLSKLPDRVVVMGDAVFSFNPFYGQGMTAAALSALHLDRCLHEQFRRSRTDLIGLSQRFQKVLAQSLQTPWLMATDSDRDWIASAGLTTTDKNPNWISRLLAQYMAEVMILSENCPESHKTIMKIYHLVKSPTAIFQPNIASRVMKQVWKRKTRYFPLFPAHQKTIIDTID